MLGGNLSSSFKQRSSSFVEPRAVLNNWNDTGAIDALETRVADRYRGIHEPLNDVRLILWSRIEFVLGESIVQEWVALPTVAGCHFELQVALDGDLQVGARLPHRLGEIRSELGRR